jgi:hypothetical protein
MSRPGPVRGWRRWPFLFPFQRLARLDEDHVERELVDPIPSMPDVTALRREQA